MNSILLTQKCVFVHQLPYILAHKPTNENEDPLLGLDLRPEKLRSKKVSSAKQKYKNKVKQMYDNNVNNCTKELLVNKVTQKV